MNVPTITINGVELHESDALVVVLGVENFCKDRPEVFDDPVGQRVLAAIHRIKRLMFPPEGGQ